MTTRTKDAPRQPELRGIPTKTKVALRAL